ncbi:MAG: chemotaxis protein CheW [Polyangiaceae bacterium]
MRASSDPSGEALVAQGKRVLLCQVGSIVCGLPLEHISETMRPLPIEPLQGMPPFVDGLAVVRGVPVPVVDLARLLGKESEARRMRFVVVRALERAVALAVERVIGVGSLPVSAQPLPSLLGEANGQFVTAVASLDSRLLVILESGRVLPPSAWQTFENRGGAA